MNLRFSLALGMISNSTTFPASENTGSTVQVGHAKAGGSKLYNLTQNNRQMVFLDTDLRRFDVHSWG